MTEDIESLIQRALGTDEEAAAEAVRALHSLGAPAYEAARRLTRSSRPNERALGAEILAQVDVEEQEAHESAKTLLGLLDDSSPSVVSAAVYGLGHRMYWHGASRLLALSRSPDAQVRFAVAWALDALTGSMPHAEHRGYSWRAQAADASDSMPEGGAILEFGSAGASVHESVQGTPHPADELLDQIVNALIRLSKDPVLDVRDWATFALTNVASDADKVSAALLERLEDEDHEVRGAAMLGLARRQDSRVVDAIERELAGPFNGVWAVDAASLFPHREFAPLLEGQRRRLDGEDAEAFNITFENAIDTCLAGDGSEPA